MLRLWQYKKKYKIILCDIIATKLGKLVSIYKHQPIFSHVKTNDNNIYLSSKNY